ncbi:MAG: pyridoxal phosphate-dependent aminotransferase [Terriglobia bacterium]
MNELARLRQEKAQLGQPVLDLTETNPAHCGFEYGDVLAQFQNPGMLRYEPDPHGLPAAREAVAAYFLRRGVHVHPEQIFLTSSTSEAYAYVFGLLTDPGDRVLAPRPSYPLLDYLASLNDITLETYPLHYDAGWQIDRQALAALLAARPRAVVVIHPNNPTGSYIHASEREFLVERCAEAQAALIADEVFLDYAYPGSAPDFSFAGEERALTFTLSGLSKISALPQMKCAWIAVSGPSEFRHEAIERLEVIADTYLSLSAPVAHALPALLEMSGSIQAQIMARLLSNLAALDGQIPPGSTITRLAIEGGWCAVLRLPALLSDEEWALLMLREDGILVHPGHFYDFEGGSFIVVSLLTRPDIFADGIARLAARVRDTAK